MYILRCDSDSFYGGAVDDVRWTNEFEAKLFYLLSDAIREVEALEVRGIWAKVVPAPSPEKVYHKYIDLVRYIVHRMKFASYINEAESYFGLLIMTGWHKHDIRVCRRTTWLGRMVSGHLLDERIKCRKHWKRRERTTSYRIPSPDTRISELSSEAQIIIGMFQADPEGCRRQFNRSNRKKKFEKSMYDRGWTISKVQSVLKELKEMLS